MSIMATGRAVVLFALFVPHAAFAQSGQSPLTEAYAVILEEMQSERIRAQELIARDFPDASPMTRRTPLVEATPGAVLEHVLTRLADRGVEVRPCAGGSCRPTNDTVLITFRSPRLEREGRLAVPVEIRLSHEDGHAHAARSVYHLQRDGAQWTLDSISDVVWEFIITDIE